MEVAGWRRGRGGRRLGAVSREEEAVAQGGEERLGLGFRLLREPAIVMTYCLPSKRVLTRVYMSERKSKSKISAGHNNTQCGLRCPSLLLQKNCLCTEMFTKAGNLKHDIEYIGTA